MFDPLLEIPHDFMIGWNTPRKTPAKAAARDSTSSQPASLLDTSNEAASPHSIKHFSEKDLEEACLKIRDQVFILSILFFCCCCCLCLVLDTLFTFQANKEQEFLQLEIQELTKKNREEVAKRKDLQTVFEEYEATMTNMISELPLLASVDVCALDR